MVRTAVILLALMAAADMVMFGGKNLRAAHQATVLMISHVRPEFNLLPRR